MKAYLSCIIFFLCGFLKLSAQSDIIVEYPDSASNGRIDIVYTFKVNDVDSSSIKSLSYDKEHLEVLSGPTISTLKSYVTRNGETTRSDTIKFTYSFRCFRKGINHVPVLTIVDSHGKELSSPSNLTFNVIKESEKNEIVGDFMEATICADKKSILLGDSVKCQIQFYTNMIATQIILKVGEKNKAILHELKTPAYTPPKMVWYRGDSVFLAKCYEFYVIPTQVGRFCLKGLSCIVEYCEIDKSVESDEAFLNGGAFVYRKKTIPIAPLYIDVKAACTSRLLTKVWSTDHILCRYDDSHKYEAVATRYE